MMGHVYCYKCNKEIGSVFCDIFLNTEDDYRYNDNYGGIHKNHHYCKECIKDPEFNGKEVKLKSLSCGDAVRIKVEDLEFICPI